MKVYILGGFLGSGKTTLLMRMATKFSEECKKVTIIVNEAADIGVDGNTLKAEGYNSIELPNGCICCTLASSLHDAMENIKKDLDPDIVIVEPTGLALPDQVADIIRPTLKDGDSEMIIGVTDIQRYKDLIKRKEEFFKKQMNGSKFLLINKCDLASKEDIEETEKYLKECFPNKDVIPVSVKTGENLDTLFGLM
ncbi:MAG: GTP-binding protein [Candidatus Methanomethylophilaceae archaeon]|jgi:G3E family GTPase